MRNALAMLFQAIASLKELDLKYDEDTKRLRVTNSNDKAIKFIDAVIEPHTVHIWDDVELQVDAILIADQVLKPSRA